MPNQTITDIYELEFDRDGKIFARGQVDAMLEGLKKIGATDLILMSHGWNNDMPDARALYGRWLESANALLLADKVAVPGRKIAFCGILWPSKKFADDEDKPAGGAASAGGQNELEALKARIRELRDGFPPEHRPAFAKLEALVPELKDEKKQAEFVETFRKVLSDPQDDGGRDTSDNFMKKPGEWVFERLSLDVDDDEGGASTGPRGGAAGLGDIWKSITGGARNVLNAGTYYQMKARAGVVGANGVHQVLREAQTRMPQLKIHLVGHSFGGRVVAACADGPDHRSDLKVSSMSLLQAAFSHFAFADKSAKHADGFFKRVVKENRVSGPIVVTHTRNDKAVGYAYAVASRLSSESAAAIGDASDTYGGIGSNGAQDTPGTVTARLLPVGGAYTLTPSRVTNLKADEFVGGHSEVTGREVVYAVLTGIATT